MNAGKIEVNGAATLAGSVSGAGSLVKTGLATITFTNTLSHSGSTRIDDGTLILAGGGNALQTPSIAIRNSLVIDNTASLADRVNDSAAVQLDGGSITLISRPSANTSETMGDVTFSSGTSTATVVSVFGEGTTISFGNASRVRGAAAFFRGRSLGSAKSDIVFATAPTLVGGGGSGLNTGIVPWAYGSTTETAGLGDATNAFVTYGTRGVRPLSASEQSGTIVSGTTTANNVRLITSNASVSSATTINSLTLVAPSSKLDGVGPLTITSGAILNLAGSDSAGFPVSVPINFGAAEGIVLSPRPIVFNAPISGTGGLTKQGEGAATFANGASTYTGTTVLGGGRITFLSDVPSGVPSPFGSDTTPIVLAPGGTTPTSLIYRGTTTATFERPLRVTSGLVPAIGSRNVNSSMQVEFGRVSSGLFPLNVNGDIELDGCALALICPQVGTLALNGNISGTGSLTDSDLSLGGSFCRVRLSGNNTFTGGVVMSRGATWLVNSDNALGTGPIVFGAGLLSTIGAVGAPRVIPNEILGTDEFGARWIVVGSQDITFTGAVRLGTGYLGVGGTNPSELSLATCAGVLHSGSLIKAGLGTLVLTGSNTYTGSTSITAGVLRITNPGALGSAAAPTTLTDGTLEVGSDVLSSEPIAFAPYQGFPNTTRTVRSLAGANTLGGIALGANGSVDVTMGSLAVGNVDGTAAADLAKRGVGDLIARRFRIDSFTLSEGTARVAPGRDPVERVSRVGLLTITGGSAPSAALDLGNNDLIVTSTPQATIEYWVASGRANGAWTGTGINSSVANGNPATGLGVLSGAEYTSLSGSSTFDGFAVAPTDTLVKYT